MRSCKVEHFRLFVLHDKTYIKKDFGHNIVTIEKKKGRQFIVLLLRN